MLEHKLSDPGYDLLDEPTDKPLPKKPWKIGLEIYRLILTNTFSVTAA